MLSISHVTILSKFLVFPYSVTVLIQLNIVNFNSPNFSVPFLLNYKNRKLRVMKSVYI